MPIIDQIESLEERVSAILAELQLPTDATPRLTRALIEGIIQTLDSYSLTDLASEDIAQLLEPVIERIWPEWEDEFQRSISTGIRDLVRNTEAFYLERGIDAPALREAISRSRRVEQLSEAYSQGMTEVNESLRLGTITAMDEAITSGIIDRDVIRKRIEEISQRGERNARVQTQAALGAYNQEYRNQLAERAELDHFHYYGPIQRNTRHFCRIHINRVYSRAQIGQMDNSMLAPVLTYRGGWNCIHSFLAVSIEWDDELRALLVPPSTPPTVIPITLSGTRTITVFADEPRIERLRKQIPLESQSFEQIIDAQSNPDGFLAVHADYFDTINDRRRKLYKESRRLRDLGLSLAEEGHAVELRITEGAPVLTVDGNPYQE